MNNLIRSVLPVAFTLIADVIELVAKGIMVISLIFSTIATTLHKTFKTEYGKKLIEVDESIKAVIKVYTDALAQQDKIKEYQDAESNKLADTAKENSNVVQLGKKKDDDTTH